MFTGIVEKSVRVISVAVHPGFRRITLACDWPDVKLGQSVAVNGCCLTIAKIESGSIGFDVIPETLDKTNLGLLEAGSFAHVERSLCVGDRLDGHFVQGHVDARANLIERIDLKEEVRLKVRAPDHLAKYLVPKGSVSLDGVSLTIAAVKGPVFEVALIPTTLNITQLDRREIGWPYNLEADVVAKTIVSWLESSQGRGPREEQRTI
jgi:riboflavin synthase